MKLSPSQGENYAKFPTQHLFAPWVICSFQLGSQGAMPLITYVYLHTKEI
jgi:hypothetical protein